MSENVTVEQEAAQVLEQMSKLLAENSAATAQQAKGIQELQASMQVLQDEVAMINAERNEMLNNLEMQAQELGLRAQRTLKADHGAITFRKGYLRVTYDSKGLEALVKSPEYEWLDQYRKESSVAASVKVEVGEG